MKIKGKLLLTACFGIGMLATASIWLMSSTVPVISAQESVPVEVLGQPVARMELPSPGEEEEPSVSLPPDDGRDFWKQIKDSLKTEANKIEDKIKKEINEALDKLPENEQEAKDMLYEAAMNAIKKYVEENTSKEGNFDGVDLPGFNFYPGGLEFLDRTLANGAEVQLSVNTSFNEKEFWDDVKDGNYEGGGIENISFGIGANKSYSNGDSWRAGSTATIPVNGGNPSVTTGVSGSYTGSNGVTWQGGGQVTVQEGNKPKWETGAGLNKPVSKDGVIGIGVSASQRGDNKEWNVEAGGIIRY